jgi:hypothetical protein
MNAYNSEAVVRSTFGLFFWIYLLVKLTNVFISFREINSRKISSGADSLPVIVPEKYFGCSNGTVMLLCPADQVMFMLLLFFCISSLTFFRFWFSIFG